MNRFKSITFIVLAGIFLITGCENAFSPPEQSAIQGNVIVSVGMGSARNARTLYPGEGFTKYELTFTGGTHDPVAVTPGTAKALDLSPGNWTITATAYTGQEGSYTAAARGSWNGEVTAGKTANAAITLAPVAGGGTGTLSWSVELPAGLQSATLIVKNTEGTAAEGSPVNLLETGRNEGSITLASGSWLLSVRLTNSSGINVGRTGAAHIYPALTTSAEYAFSAGDFSREELPNPANLRATALSAGAVKISWDAVAGASGYSIYWSDDGDFWLWIDECEETSYIDSEALDPGTTYYYAVYSLDADGWEGGGDDIEDDETVSVTTLAAPVAPPAPGPDQPAPATPDAPVFAEEGSIILKRTEEGVTLQWTTVNGAASYKIYRANTRNTGDYAHIGTVPSDTGGKYDDLTVDLNSAGTSYYYKVTAVNSAGMESEKSAPHGFTVTKPVIFAFNSAKSTTGTVLLGSFLSINGMDYHSYTPSTALTLDIRRNGAAHETLKVSLQPGTYAYETRYAKYDAPNVVLTKWVDRGNITLKPLHTYKISALNGTVVSAVSSLTIEK